MRRRAKGMRGRGGVPDVVNILLGLKREGCCWF